MVVSMAHEEWRDVVGYEGLYEVSNLGNVRGVDRTHFRTDKSGNKYPVHVRARALHKKDNTNGYYRVNLSKNNRVKAAFVHRLVAEAFLEKVDGCDCVDHINSDRHDNRLENLQWVSQGMNIHLSYARDGRVSVFKSRQDVIEKCHNATKKAIVRSDGATFNSVSEAALAIGVTPACVSHALCGRCKTVRGFKFSYV